MKLFKKDVPLHRVFKARLNDLLGDDSYNPSEKALDLAEKLPIFVNAGYILHFDSLDEQRRNKCTSGEKRKYDGKDLLYALEEAKDLQSLWKKSGGDNPLAKTEKFSEGGEGIMYAEGYSEPFVPLELDYAKLDYLDELAAATATTLPTTLPLPTTTSTTTPSESRGV
jgi:hypothetical protein